MKNLRLAYLGHYLPVDCVKVTLAVKVFPVDGRIT